METTSTVKLSWPGGADDLEEHRFPTRQNLRMRMEQLAVRKLQDRRSGASRWGQPQHTICGRSAGPDDEVALVVPIPPA